jgi:hypothetical protein
MKQQLPIIYVLPRVTLDGDHGAGKALGGMPQERASCRYDQ